MRGIVDDTIMLCVKNVHVTVKAVFTNQSHGMFQYEYRIIINANGRHKEYVAHTIIFKKNRKS